jgi:uncharacterized protein with NRDE domain
VPSVCLILFALRVHRDFPLVLAANRDEYFARPTLPVARWPGAAGVVAGRDGIGGGTWLGISSEGRVAALTNYRDRKAIPAGAPSRGRLVVEYLEASDSPEVHLQALHAGAQRYAGFSLLVGTAERLWYYSNREGRVLRCEDGVHGLSNHLLETPWPKVVLGRSRLSALLRSAHSREAIEAGALELLSDTALALDAALPNTGLPLELERALSAIRIASPGYGTRTSTVLLADRDGTLHLTERTLPVGDQVAADRSFSIPRGAHSARS